MPITARGKCEYFVNRVKKKNSYQWVLKEKQIETIAALFNRQTHLDRLLATIEAIRSEATGLDLPQRYQSKLRYIQDLVTKVRAKCGENLEVLLRLYAYQITQLIRFHQQFDTKKNIEFKLVAPVTREKAINLAEDLFLTEKFQCMKTNEDFISMLWREIYSEGKYTDQAPCV